MAHQLSSKMQRVILWLNLIIMIFPPVHLFMARGHMALAMLFFMGSGIVLVISMFALTLGTDTSEAG